MSLAELDPTQPGPDQMAGPRQLAGELAALSHSEAAPPAPEVQRPRLGSLASGEAVYDRPDSHTHVHSELVGAALSGIQSGGRDFMVETVDFGDPVGETTCVETGPDDQIVYAQRVGRKGLTRFVVGRQPEPSSEVTVIVARDRTSPQDMNLITSFIGSQAAPEPWDRKADPVESPKFWGRHALIWGSEPVVPGTERFTPPPATPEQGRKPEKVIYTGYFLDEATQGALKTNPLTAPRNPDWKVYASHITNRYRPAEGQAGVNMGAERTVYITGMVTGENVQAAIVAPAEGEVLPTEDQYAHITIAAAEGTKPDHSNDVIAEAMRTGRGLQTFERPIPVKVTEGYFARGRSITGRQAA